MSPELQSTALAAVAEALAKHGENGLLLRATKLIRERSGVDVRTALDAARWAAHRPPAAMLPPGSIVGSAEAACIKIKPLLWHSTDSPRAYGDHEIDAMLQAGRAHILRTGGLS